MSSLFERFKGRREPTSAEIAKQRLKLVLVSDRSDLAPEKLAEMQAEIIEVIRRYIPIDAMDVQIKIEQRERKHYLVADIPLQREPGYVPPEDGAEPELGLSVEISSLESPAESAPAEAGAPVDPGDPEWIDEPDADD
jgi:cell division topological specificity factor